ncbi:hypothetical protein ACIQVR_41785 [Streptomyces xanthochromogenes]|uniref:hypothetical protein n=1 Tax=Streptomyces xanthochromogenes TaxID=67384 RepID=UPI0038008DB3
MTDNPPKAAVDNGHVLEWDPPVASAALRWTCRHCGAAALQYGSNEYGSATEKTCPEGGERDGD